MQTIRREIGPGRFRLEKCEDCPGNTRKKIPLAEAIPSPPTSAPRERSVRIPVAPGRSKLVTLPVPSSALLTGGIGDIFAVESMLTPEERESLETLYYACPSWRQAMDLFRSVPLAYPKLKHHVRIRFTKVYYTLAQVEEEHGNLDGATDWSVGPVFRDPTRHYTGSTFLHHRLAPAMALPQPYWVVHSQTSWGKRDGRDFDAADWQACLALLDRAGVHGVILHHGQPKEDQVQAPAHNRLVNLFNQTTITEAVEILKWAEGYVGIDSCFSVLAAKLFPLQNLHVKADVRFDATVKPKYYAPRTDFSFMRPGLEVTP